MDLSDRRQLTLERPDLSARESVTLVLAYATEGIRKLPAFMLSIAGAGDGSGRLVPNGCRSQLPGGDQILVPASRAHTRESFVDGAIDAVIC